MRIRSKALSAAWKCGIALCAAIGIALQMQEGWSLSPFRFYTNQSNLLCLVYFLADAAYQLARKAERAPQSLLPAVKGAATMGITVTWLVSAFLLGDFDMGARMRVSILLVHTIVPIAVLLDWLLFDEKGRLTRYAPLIWTIFPLMYFIYAMIASQIGGGIGYGGSRYPYPFIDADALGIGRVLVNVALLTLFFVALGYAFVLADRLLFRAGEALARRREGQPPTA